jgi:hypothetical protein
MKRRSINGLPSAAHAARQSCSFTSADEFHKTYAYFWSGDAVDMSRWK